MKFPIVKRVCNYLILAEEKSTEVKEGKKQKEQIKIKQVNKYRNNFLIKNILLSYEKSIKCENVRKTKQCASVDDASRIFVKKKTKKINKFFSRSTITNVDKENSRRFLFCSANLLDPWRHISIAISNKKKNNNNMKIWVWLSTQIEKHLISSDQLSSGTPSPNWIKVMEIIFKI